MHTETVMSSEKRIAASRANGKKSRGPVTEEGKRASSRNAQTHGLCANTIIIQGESVERFNSMLAALIDVHRPTDEMEMQLVEAMAVNNGASSANGKCSTLCIPSKSATSRKPLPGSRPKLPRFAPAKPWTASPSIPPSRTSEPATTPPSIAVTTGPPGNSGNLGAKNAKL